MIPVHQLLNRIKWDMEFGKGNFTLGYYDRIADTIIRVSFADIHFTADNRYSISVRDKDGVFRAIPMHRIREVYKNGTLIWHRG